MTSNASPRRSHLRCLRRWSVPPRSSTYLSCHGDRHTARESFHLPILATFPASFFLPHPTSSEGGCSDLWFYSFFFLSLEFSFYTKRLEGLDLHVGILKSRDNLKRTMRLFLFLGSGIKPTTFTPQAGPLTRLSRCCCCRCVYAICYHFSVK